MDYQRIKYTREDLYGLSYTKTFLSSTNIIDTSLFEQLCQQRLYTLHNKNKRGCRAGRQVKRKHNRYNRSQRGITIENLIFIKNTSLKSGKQGKAKSLPSIYYTNCRSLNYAKTNELESHLIKYNSDIACLTETWTDDIKASYTVIKGFKPHLANRKNRIGGGAAILVKNTFTTQTLSKYESDTVSCIWLKIDHTQFKTTLVGCLYHPPSATPHTTNDYLEDCLSKYSKRYPNITIILAGDFNKLCIDGIIDRHGLSDLVNFETRGSAKLDRILTNASSYKNAMKHAPLAKNDHCSIEVQRTGATASTYGIKTKRNITKPVKENIICDLLKTNWDTVINCSDLDLQIDFYYNKINNILDQHAPIVTKKVRLDKPFIETPLITKLRNAKDRAYKKGSPAWKTFAVLLRKTIRKTNTLTTSKIMEKQNNTRSWWNYVKQLTSKSTTISPDHYLIDGKWMSCSEFADGLCNHFACVASDVKSNLNSLPINIITSTKLQEIPISWVKHQIKLLDLHKATNSFDYPVWVTKEAVESLCVPITKIINNMLHSNTYPTKWKSYEIKPIAKLQQPTCYKDYRPIALSYHLAKIAENAILSKLTPSIEISGNQFAYQPEANTTKALIHMLHNWCSALDKPNISRIDALFIDMSKAFDRLNPETLCNKLQSQNINNNLIQLLSNYLHNRQLHIKIGHTFSSTYSTDIGVPQGSRLGPILWLVYIDDMVPPGSITKYADDCSLYSPVIKGHTSVLGQSAKYVEQWCSKNSMIINADKSVVMNILPKNTKDRATSTVKINDVNLTIVNKTKILGIIIDDKLTFTHHVTVLIHKTNSKIFLMKKLSAYGFNEYQLLKFYKACILPTLLYGIEAFYGFLSKEDKERLESTNNYALKLIFGTDGDYSDRIVLANSHSIEQFYLAKLMHCFNSIIHTNRSQCPLHETYVSFINNNRRSGRMHNSSQFNFKARTELFKKSFFLKNFMLC